MSWTSLLAATRPLETLESRTAAQDGAADLLSQIVEANPTLFWYPGSGDDLTPLVLDRPGNPTGQRLLRLGNSHDNATSILWMNDYREEFWGFPSSNAVLRHTGLWNDLGASVEVVGPVFRYGITAPFAAVPLVPLAVFRVRVDDANAAHPRRPEGEEFTVLFSGSESEQLLRNVFSAHNLRIKTVALIRQGGWSHQRSHFPPNDDFEQYRDIPRLINELGAAVGAPDAYIVDRDHVDIPGYQPTDLQTPFGGSPGTRLWRRSTIGDYNIEE